MLRVVAVPMTAVESRQPDFYIFIYLFIYYYVYIFPTLSRPNRKQSITRRVVNTYRVRS
jgi:hypothetical protein